MPSSGQHVNYLERLLFWTLNHKLLLYALSLFPLKWLFKLETFLHGTTDFNPIRAHHA